MIYRARLNGKNFLIDFDGKIKRVGFYTTRDVEADSFEEAEKKALEILRNDDFLTSAVRNSENDSPMIFIEEVSASNESEITVKTGFTFYVEEE